MHSIPRLIIGPLLACVVGVVGCAGSGSRTAASEKMEVEREESTFEHQIRCEGSSYDDLVVLAERIEGEIHHVSDVTRIETVITAEEPTLTISVSVSAERDQRAAEVQSIIETAAPGCEISHP